ncbi:MAG: hypothetical protein ACPG49_07100 [Chitinophagales bacterium]
MKPSTRYKEQLAPLTHPQLLELAKEQGNEAIFMEFTLDIDLEKLSTKLEVEEEYKEYEKQFSISFDSNPQKTANLMTDYSNFLLELICLPKN